ncbi:MAG: TIGR00153 family protein [Calditrichaeota bacterium]|nr:TIGR00153 family protein [Calditrichota bacterium]
MKIVAKLFGKSPFLPLQEHMNLVRECAHKVPELFVALKAKDYEKFDQLVKDISELEHRADLKKNDIRSHLPKTTFLPVARGDLLDILSIQDSISDTAEDVGVLLSMKRLDFPTEIENEFNEFIQKVTQTLNKSWEIIDQIDELLEYTFSGPEADKVCAIIDEVCYLEHEADQSQMKMLQSLFNQEDKFSKGEFILYLKAFEKVADISNYSEKLANRIRTLLLTD